VTYLASVLEGSGANGQADRRDISTSVRGEGDGARPRAS
jgi:hypothetical protein